METAENYQQQTLGSKEQTVIIDPALTAETDELNPIFAEEQQVGPEDEDEDDDQNEDDDDFPAREDLEYDGDDPGLDQDGDDDLGLDTDDDEEDFY